MCSQLEGESRLLTSIKFHFLVSPPLPTTLYIYECMQVYNTHLYSVQSYSPGRIPLDPRLAQSLEDGQSFVDTYRGSPTETAVSSVVQKLLSETVDSNRGILQDNSRTT